MAGRLSKAQKALPPKYPEVADKWLAYIGTIYDEYLRKYMTMAKRMKYHIDEDVFQDTVIACYESIQRNGLKDDSEQGMRNYLFNAFKININGKDNYTKRKDDIEDLRGIYEEYVENETPTYIKTKEQLLTDYSVMYVLEKIENNFDTVSFHCFRLKNLLPKITYAKLREMTNVKDCKKRVVKINKWLATNVNKREVYEAFITDFPDFYD